METRRLPGNRSSAPILPLLEIERKKYRILPYRLTSHRFQLIMVRPIATGLISVIWDKDITSTRNLSLLYYRSRTTMHAPNPILHVSKRHLSNNSLAPPSDLFKLLAVLHVRVVHQILGWVNHYRSERWSLKRWTAKQYEELIASDVRLENRNIYRVSTLVEQPT